MVDVQINEDSTVSGDISIPFHCASCEGDVESTADPLDILFGSGTITLTCPNCGTEYQSSVTLEEDS